jgi:xanthine dehydrogenase accessory factor
VIVTRGHRDDMRALRWAVQTPARYIGMIGSKRKVMTIYRELQNEGLPRHLFERVHAPIGLDIGAVTPEEIAVAITAEMIAVRRHSEAALPHMRVITKETAPTDSPDSSDIDESIRHKL